MDGQEGDEVDRRPSQTEPPKPAAVVPKDGARAVAIRTAQDVMRVPESLEAAGKFETLRRVRQRIGSVVSIAVQTGRRADNAIRDIQSAFEAPNAFFAPAMSARSRSLGIGLSRPYAHQVSHRASHESAGIAGDFV